ncbi:MAG: tail fiber domain-containing protein [Bacteroidota bacterium]
MKTRLLSLMLMVIGFSGANAQTWNLAGNAGTDPTTMFIGTTDSKALRFRTNNGVRMHISSFGKIGIGTTNPIFKMDLVGGSYNTDSLYRIKGVAVLSRDNSNRIQLGDATAKVGIGTVAPANTLQVVGDASFSQDINVNGISIGKGAGSFLTNTTSGLQALSNNTTGENNSAFGWKALVFNTTGSNNTANGSGALFANTAGFNNSAFGQYALGANTNGYANTALGAQSLYANTTGYANTGIGQATLTSNINGFSNTAIGQASLYYSTSGNFNSALGSESLFNTTQGSYNTAIGYRALYFNTTGTLNTAIGSGALAGNTFGGANTANGASALANNTYGVENTAVGCYSLGANTLGINNTAIGYSSLITNLSGNGNTASGWYALGYNRSGEYNAGFGFHALLDDSSSSYNTAVGTSAGSYWINGNANTFIGGSARAFGNGRTNSTAIGYNSEVDASNKVRIGNTAITSIGGQVAWTTFSDGRYKRNVEEDVPGLEFITKLRPVTYTSDITGLNNHYPKPALREGQRQAPEQDVTSQEAIRYSGFIAQEVETAAKEIGYDFSGVDKPQREGNLYGLRYSDFVVPMVKAIQEQQGIIEKQQKEIAELKSLIKGDNSSGAIKIGVTDGRDEILLGQNIPNPADNSTIIPFSIPTNCKSASILITDHATGRAIKAVPLSCKDTHLMLDAGSLASGTYSYSLFVDGVNIDTKQMVIVK